VGSVGLAEDFINFFGGAQAQPQGIEELLRRLEAGEFDLVGVGRALLADPQWLNKVREGRLEDVKAFDRSALASLA